MESWKPGDIAIAVITGKLSSNIAGSALPPLRLNAEYIVNKVAICECGSVTLDVGLALAGDCTMGVKCKCGARKSPATNIHWANAVRFRKKNTKTLEEQLEEAVTAEDYETAQVLVKQIKSLTHGTS